MRAAALHEVGGEVQIDLDMGRKDRRVTRREAHDHKLLEPPAEDLFRRRRIQGLELCSRHSLSPSVLVIRSPAFSLIAGERRITRVREARHSVEWFEQSGPPQRLPLGHPALGERRHLKLVGRAACTLIGEEQDGGSELVRIGKHGVRLGTADRLNAGIDDQQRDVDALLT